MRYTKEALDRHPCFSADAHHKYARMHLPVAPRCNVQCNYCNRKFDCINESRPGVTSEILSPLEAKEKFMWARKKLKNLSVVGIAGPGDALANWKETRETLEYIKAIDNKIIFCLSTNGLLLPEYAQELIDLDVNHVTVTMNAIDVEIGARIYSHVKYSAKTYTGIEGAEVLLEQQLNGIEYLTNRGVLVKINVVMIDRLNENHIPMVVKTAKKLGAKTTNIMPLIPAPGSVFEKLPSTCSKGLVNMRKKCQLDLPQMWHCKQCRADAVGMLGKDISRECTIKKKVIV